MEKRGNTTSENKGGCILEIRVHGALLKNGGDFTTRRDAIGRAGRTRRSETKNRVWGVEYGVESTIATINPYCNGRQVW